ncbi:MAG: response regulator [Calditrichaceae bacterium]|nr:response regulator [Calditrichaceae bacterium]
MGKKYKRVKNVEEKIHSAKLPYNAWKVFFLIDGSVGSEQIAEYLDDELSVIDDSLQRLISEGLVDVEASEEVKETKEEKELVEEQTAGEPEVEEEFEVEEQPEFEYQSEADESLELDLDEEITEIEEEPVSQVELTENEADLTDDLISVVEDEEEVEEEPVVEDETVTDFSLDNLDLEDTLEMEAETDTAVEEDIEVDTGIEDEIEAGSDETEEETLEIDLQDMENKEEENEGIDLNIDFADEEPAAEAVVEEQPQPEEAKPEEPSPEELADMKTILVVDDSIVIRKMVEIALEDENYKIETAVSGKDGLAILDEKNPSLMILDLMLPDINGIDLLKTVKASKGIPVIMLSGKDSPQMVEKARSEGADAFLPKPFKDDELVSKIRELLG